MFEKALKITPFIKHNLKPRRSLLCLFQISFVLKISLNQPHISCFYCFLLKKFIPNLILIMYWNSISNSGFVNLFFVFRPVDGASEETNPVPDSLWRRYSEFELLRNYLLVTYPFLVVPPLPEKRVCKQDALVTAACKCDLHSCTVTSCFLQQAEFVWHKLSADNMDPDFVERRRVGLENFLLRVASHAVLSSDKIFYLFLTEVETSRLSCLDKAKSASNQWHATPTLK